MFDTMTMTKVVGAGCGSLLVLLLGSWAAEALYTTSTPSHGDEEHAQAYSIDTGAAEAGPAEDAVPFADLLAAADAGAGEKVFAKCKACHKLDGTNGTGPHLDGIVNKAKASSEGFAYSPALTGMAGETWTPENLDGFLHDPKGYAPGTKMTFAGLPKPEDRANLVAYLQTQ